MNNNYDQLKIEYSATDKESKSVRLMCVFLILIFAFAPLAEIVTDLDYNTIENYSRHTCISDLDYSFEHISFKEVK